MLRNVNISIRIPVLIAVAVMISIAGVAVMAFRSAAYDVKHLTTQKLIASSAYIADEVTEILEAVDSDVRYNASNPTTIQAVQNFVASAKKFEGDPLDPGPPV